MDGRAAGLRLIVAGLGLVVAGGVVWGGWLNFFGRLPGDFRYEGEGTRVYVPWVSCLVVSVVLSLLAAVAKRFF